MSSKLLGTTRCERLIQVFSKKVHNAAHQLQISENDFQRWLDENNIRPVYESYEQGVRDYKDLGQELQNKYAIIFEVLYGDDGRNFCGMHNFDSLRQHIQNKLNQKFLQERKRKLLKLVDEFSEKIWLLGSGDELKDLLDAFDTQFRETLEEINS